MCWPVRIELSRGDNLNDTPYMSFKFCTFMRFNLSFVPSAPRAMSISKPQKYALVAGVVRNKDSVICLIPGWISTILKIF